MLVALTGTTGFLGRRFAAAARAAGHGVRGLVRRGKARAPAGIAAVQGDLGDRAAVRSLLERADVLVHLAAAGVQSRDRDPARLALVNAVEPLALLEAAKAAGVRHAVLAGTCLEYTGHGRLPEAPAQGSPPCGEESPTGPADPYGASKAVGGLAARRRARELGLPAWYLRLASIYGPGDDPEKLLPAAIRCALARKPLDITPGEQVREWLHVDDAVRALLAAVAAPPPEPVAIVNVGTGEGMRLVDLVRSTFTLAGADPSLVRAGARPYRRGEVHRLVMDVSAAAGALGGWHPAISLEEGLAALVREIRAGAGRRIDGG